jgi:NADH/F420H2 dehydrogenase subunit C
MTVVLSGTEIAGKLREKFPESIIDAKPQFILVKPESLLEIATFLKDAPEYKFNYLTSVTAVDYYDYFEAVYHLTSIDHNHSLVLKTRCAREKPVLPSVVRLWQAADLQEREIYDLLGITFEGHPNLKRIVLWEGFQGHPLRKDYLA